MVALRRRRRRATAPPCRIFDFNLDDDISPSDLPKLHTALSQGR
jgi:hypothetical protein